MPTVEEVVSRLKNPIRKSNGGYMAFCPTHPDDHRSLSIDRSDEGGVLLKCFANSGCTQRGILKSLGFIDEPIEKKKIVATYDYTDENGNLIYQTVRYFPKDFRHRRPDPKDKTKWIWDLKGVEHLLYNLPALVLALSEAKTVFIVEGEKDVETLKRHDEVATTCSGGARSWKPQFTDYFQASSVVILPDNDPPGWEYAEGIAKTLYGFAKSLKVVKLPVNEKQDVSDFLETNTINKLWNLVNNSGQFIPTGAVTREEYNSLKWHLIYLNRKYNEALKVKIYGSGDLT